MLKSHRVLASGIGRDNPLMREASESRSIQYSLRLVDSGFSRTGRGNKFHFHESLQQGVMSIRATNGSRAVEPHLTRTSISGDLREGHDGISGTVTMRGAVEPKAEYAGQLVW